MAKTKQRLRSGYTTGACAAAAAKAAALLLAGGEPAEVEIPFPDQSRVAFPVRRQGVEEAFGAAWRFASVIKDAGDDPDVTNGAEIVARVRWLAEKEELDNAVALPGGGIVLAGGQGVGRVTRPGLAVPPGEPAINPVPRRMIAQAVAEAVDLAVGQRLAVEIAVPNGEELARRTLNHRLGIVGGLSILGTTGIVRPVSAEAWTATIAASLSVARAAGFDEAVLSTGRTSENGVRRALNLPDEACAMMGDYLEFSLREARRQGFGRIHLAAMWAKMLKAALEIPQTHVRHGALEVAACLPLFGALGADEALIADLARANTAREIHEKLLAAKRHDLVALVCRRARDYAERVSGLPVTVWLVSASATVELSL